VEDSHTPGSNSVTEIGKDAVTIWEDRVMARIRFNFLKGRTWTLLDKVVEQNLLSIDKHKSWCREQLAAATARLKKDTLPFAVLWEHCILPFLSKFIEKWCGRSYAVGVVRGKGEGNNSRCVYIMTKNKISRSRRFLISHQILDLLVEPYRESTSISFSEGQVARLRERAVDNSDLDEVCEPRNPHHFERPCMGDSIGLENDEATATLGPRIRVDDRMYWLASFHPFVDVWEKPVDIQHPSLIDSRFCDAKRNKLAGKNLPSTPLGRLNHASGSDLTTTRISNEPYWKDTAADPPRLVTDWSLISSKDRGANYVRILPTDKIYPKVYGVTVMSHIKPGAEVVASGRTSGLQRGRICEVPMLVSGSDPEDGRDGNRVNISTREWFVESLDLDGNGDEWIRGGIGVPGDSGAAIVDANTSVLYGQLWGRNQASGPGPRITYFTPIRDIIDDVVEKCGWDSRPGLPQVEDGELINFPTYPVCCSLLPEDQDKSETNASSQVSTSASMVARCTQRSEGSPAPSERTISGPTWQPDRQDWGQTNSLLFGHMGPGAGSTTPLMGLQKSGRKRASTFGSDATRGQLLKRARVKEEEETEEEI